MPDLASCLEEHAHVSLMQNWLLKPEPCWTCECRWPPWQKIAGNGHNTLCAWHVPAFHTVRSSHLQIAPWTEEVTSSALPCSRLLSLSASYCALRVEFSACNVQLDVKNQELGDREEQNRGLWRWSKRSASVRRLVRSYALSHIL